MSRVALTAVWMTLALAPACRPAVDICRGQGLCVDCTSTCERMVECSVTFSEPGPVLPGSDEGEQAQCERGCASTDTITPERERCILATDPGNLERCHRAILVCLGVDGGAGGAL